MHDLVRLLNQCQLTGFLDLLGVFGNFIEISQQKVSASAVALQRLELSIFLQDSSVVEDIFLVYLLHRVFPSRTY